MRSKTIISSFLILSLLYSCSRRPSNILNEEKLKEVLYDVQLAQAIGNDQSLIYNTSQKKRLLVVSALDRHGVSMADFDSTLLWYSDNDISKYNEINDTIASQLRNKVNTMRENMVVGGGKRLSDGQIMSSIVYLTDNNPIASFNLDSTQIKKLNLPAFKWSFDIQGISPIQKVNAGLIFTYKDTTISILRPLNTNKHYVFDKPQLSDSLLVNIAGYIRLRNANKPADIIVFNIQSSDSLTTSIKNLPEGGEAKIKKDELRKSPSVDRSLPFEKATN